MTDIVERLRDMHNHEDTALRIEAVAEIARLRAALGELLSGHDNLYIAHFGPDSNPHDDIAAKPARRALEPKP
jgi:hypothetical protein